MTRRRHHWLTRLYPPQWRARYGDEMDDLLESNRVSWRDAIDVMKAAAIERLFDALSMGVRSMPSYRGSVAILARKPSAIVPIAMSMCALAVVLIAVIGFGAKREPDEGAAAHLWQLLIAGQMPFVGWFALRWLASDWKAALPVLGAQMVALGAALFPVWLLGL